LPIESWIRKTLGAASSSSLLAKPNGQEVTAAQALQTTKQTGLTLAQFKMFAICKTNTPKAKRVVAELLAATIVGPSQSHRWGDHAAYGIHQSRRSG
jgi:hypothetical protein